MHSVDIHKPSNSGEKSFFFKASISMNGKQVMNVSATSVPLVSSPFSAFGFCLKPDKESMAIATLHSPSAVSTIDKARKKLDRWNSLYLLKFDDYINSDFIP